MLEYHWLRSMLFANIVQVSFDFALNSDLDMAVESSSHTHKQSMPKDAW
jgi:hypothetical protein